MKAIIPFEPISTNCAPTGAGWVSQIKWDGVRMLAYCNGSAVTLFNRRQNARTAQYPEFLSPSAYCSASSFILDGEFVAFDEHRPSFHQIMKRDRLQKKAAIEQAVHSVPVTYMIFDVLFCNGQWVTDKPLSERQSLLSDMIKPQDRVQVAQNFPADMALLEVMKQHKMEGVVYKDLASRYGINEKDKRWRKHKYFRDLIAVIGGVTYRGGLVNALLLGVYTPDGQLHYIGHAGSGRVTEQEWRDLTVWAERMRLPAMPFINQPERSKGAVWVQPALAVKVQYMELTPHGTMRHPSIQAFVEASPQSCGAGQLD